MGHDFIFEVVPVSEAAAGRFDGPENDDDRDADLDVLVVDDEPLIAHSLTAILGVSGLSAASATSGESALEMALARRPRILLTDVAMPGMDGIELAIAVRLALPGCRVLLFSGHATTMELLRGRAAGYDFPLLSKPMHPVELVKRVRECAGWEPLRRVPIGNAFAAFGMTMAAG
jgi:CheY-like chemotaxis protein